jgi:hypothetical protein
MGFGSYIDSGRALSSFAGPSSGAGRGGVLQVTPDFFFDRRVVRDAVDRATLRALRRIGGRIRLTARRSIRRREGPSSPGRPPNTQTGFLREDILYGLDATDRSVVVGPWRSPWMNELHEFGGVSKSGVYPERPFMGPALEANEDQIGYEFENRVRA